MVRHVIIVINFYDDKILGGELDHSLKLETIFLVSTDDRNIAG